MNTTSPGAAHFGGRANMDESGNDQIMGLDGSIFRDAYIFSDRLAGPMLTNTRVDPE